MRTRSGSHWLVRSATCGWGLPASTAVAGVALGVVTFREPSAVDRLLALIATLVLLGAAVSRQLVLRVLRIQYERVAHAAMHDPLTGLANRRRFAETLDALVAQ